MKVSRPYNYKAFVFLLAFTLTVVVTFTVPSALSAPARGGQKCFTSPEDAVKAFMEAMRTDNRKALSAIFGPSVSRISSGDAVQDRADRKWFLEAYEEKNSLQKESYDKAVLLVGKEDWPFPFPLMKKNSVWVFDSKAGAEELINRRIGRNELRVMEAIDAYVAAQREFAGEDREGRGTHTYATRFMSTPGNKDGLYWEAKEGEKESPLGPLVARAAKEGYVRRTNIKRPSPFHGYYFRILTAQGEAAPGGAYDYLVKGNMILGFGLIAYPAKYGSSGIMTFIVNQEGVIYQKDLGRNTKKSAAAIQKYDPDRTWGRAR